ncbi:CoA ester lyase [Marmoricola sp. URHB0036]|uniref:HpcH/HpaI aldolase/citrate lyase family protein n=1 Tax=Marmoricola sp. URHB0036 TaxID=1298863 RepID=UPI000413722B|nr:CoA ester lyase [Marmoricola sp. URHB0036]
MTRTQRGAESVTWLFVPGSRGDRFDRAAGSGADEVILDLEDAVSPADKGGAREQVATWLDANGSGWVRINGSGTDWHDEDLATLGGRTGLRGVVVPKSEDPAALSAVRDRLPDEVGLVALVESALGVDRSRELATCDAVSRLAFGSIDYALDIGAEETDEALLLARSSLVMASRLGELPAPLDGVTVSTSDSDTTREAAVRARRLGFGGKLCIHPHQVAPVAEGFRPTAEQLDWATRVVEAGVGVGVLDGQMVDRPVVARARSILARGGVRP